MKTIFCILFSMSLLFTLACCSSDEDNSSVINDGLIPRQLTITQHDVSTRSLNELTRASLFLKNDGTLGASWQAGDKLTYCNLSCLYLYQIGAVSEVIGTLEAENDGLNSNLSGSVSCTNGDDLVVIYPTKGTFVTTTNDATYTFPLCGQNGKLDDLAANYHLICGLVPVEVDNPNDKIAKGSITMKSLLAVCKFSFVDSNNNEKIPIDVLTISYGNNQYNYNDQDTYPQSVSFTVSESIQQNLIEAKGVVSNDKLVINPMDIENEVYVVLAPTRTRSFVFCVQSSNGEMYSGTFEDEINGDEFIDATGLPLTKVTN